MWQNSGADSENSTPAYSTIRAAGQGAGVWRVRTKPRYEYRAAGTGTCAAAARRRQRLSRRRAAGRWRWVLLGGPSLRAKRRAAARKIRCDAMRCAAVVSARPGPARQTGERTAGLHPSPMCERAWPWPWLFYPRG
jgi:hypothetical protein